MTENEIFKNHLEPLIRFGIKFESIENGVHNEGYPDVSFFSKRNGTIELKVAGISADSFVRPKWQKGQIGKNTMLSQFSNFVYLLIFVRTDFYLLTTFKREYSREEMEDAKWQGKKLDKSFIRALLNG